MNAASIEYIFGRWGRPVDAFELSTEVVDRILHAIETRAFSFGTLSGEDASGEEADRNAQERAAARRAAMEARRARIPVPSRDELRLLLGIAFQTSLVVDEGRGSVFQILVGGREIMPGNLVTEFNEPISLDSQSLGHLATCAHLDEAAIAIHHEDLKIWGMVELPRRAGPIPAQPVALQIKILRPGAMVVSVNAKEVARFADGQLRQISDRHFDDHLTMNTIGQALSLPFREGLVLGSHTLTIAREMVRFGHGGTLLVSASRAALAKIKYPARPGGGSALRNALRELGLLVEQQSQDPLGPPSAQNGGGWFGDGGRRERLQEEVGEALRQVARFSQTDGAVLVKPDLDLVGFGCFIQTCEVALVQEMNGFDTSKRTPMRLEDVGGARHQSAVAFVAANPESVAFVASQDGGLTLLAPTTQDGVVVIRPVM